MVSAFPLIIWEWKILCAYLSKCCITIHHARSNIPDSQSFPFLIHLSIVSYKRITSVSMPWLNEAGAQPRSTSSKFNFIVKINDHCHETFCFLVDSFEAGVPWGCRVALALLHCPLVLSPASHHHHYHHPPRQHHPHYHYDLEHQVG